MFALSLPAAQQTTIMYIYSIADIKSFQYVQVEIDAPHSADMEMFSSAVKTYK